MTQEDIVILSQLLDQKFEPVYTRLDLLESDVRELKGGMSEIKQRVASVEQKVTELDQRVASVEQKVTKLEQKVTELDQKFTVLDEKVTVLDQKFTVLDEKVTGLELVIENETNVNIRRIAEGHCDLVRNLREARKVDDEKELLAIRVTVLESDMSKVKHQLAITLNDYLYSGDTVLRILKKYISDLRISAVQKHNEVDLVHCNFLIQIMKLLEHNDFLTSQSQKIREFYKYMAQEYPYLSFTFKGRIKSLIRAEGKFNGYIVEYIYDYYEKNGSYPSVSEIKERLNCFRDLIAYRIVISMPRCHMKQKQDRKKEEIRYLYRIANVLPQFLEERGFTAEPTGGVKRSNSLLLDDAVRPYYRDYIDGESTNSYRSLHITFFDNSARCYMEMQLRTKEMDDIAEIGVANHLFYEKKQETSRGRRDAILQGGCIYFDEAYERCRLLQDLDLSGVDVNMFTAVNNSLMNDGCGLFRGRLILPYEHLSKFQNDMIGEHPKVCVNLQTDVR